MRPCQTPYYSMSCPCWTITDEGDVKWIVCNITLQSSRFCHSDLGLVCADLFGTETRAWSKNPPQGHQITGITLCTTRFLLSDNVMLYLYFIFSYWRVRTYFWQKMGLCNLETLELPGCWTGKLNKYADPDFIMITANTYCFPFFF